MQDTFITQALCTYVSVNTELQTGNAEDQQSSLKCIMSDRILNRGLTSP